MPGVRLPGLAAPGFSKGQFQALPAPWGQPLSGEASRCAKPDQPHQSAPQDLGGKTLSQQHPCPRPPALPGDTQQQMLGAHIAVPQLSGAFLGQT